MPARPDPPTNVSATDGVGTNVVITWDAVNGVQGYNIWRSTSQGEQGIQIGSTTGLLWTDTTAVANKLYWYGVTSVRGGTCSILSIQDSGYWSSGPVTPAPVITNALATPTELPFGGGSVTVSCTVANATAVTLDGVTMPITGFSVSRSITVSHTFHIVATGLGGSAQASLPVVVDPPPPPTITDPLATPNSFAFGGGTTTISATIANATAVTLDGTSVGAGSFAVARPVTVSHTFQIIATGPGGTASANVPVTVDSVPPGPPKPVISSFTATPSTINLGSSSTLNATVTGATSMTLDGVTVVSFPQTVSPTSTHAYHLVATNTTGSSDAFVTVTVVIPPPPIPSPPTGVSALVS
jgi:hypothetical protein